MPQLILKRLDALCERGVFVDRVGQFFAVFRDALVEVVILFDNIY